MKKNIFFVLLVCLLLAGVQTVWAEDIFNSLVLSLEYDESGQITDKCGNFTVDYSASFPDKQNKYPNNYEVKTIDSENGKTKVFHSEYGEMKLTGDMMDDIAALQSATMEFWIKFDAETVASNYNTIWRIVENGSSKSAQEWQFQTQSNGSINARIRMAYNNKEADDNHKWIDPIPLLSDTNGRWAHIVAVKERLSDGKYCVSAYLDGKLLKTVTQKPEGEYSDENTYMEIIGRIESIDIGAVNIYNKALTADEIKTAYDNTLLSYIPLPEEMNPEQISVEGGTKENPAEINMYEETIRITFSNYIDNSTLDNIVFYDIDGNIVDIETNIVTSDKKSLLIKFGTLDEGVVYKLVIGKGILSVNGYSPNEETIYYYVARDKREPLKYLQCDPESGELSVRDGEVRLYFSQPVDETTIKDAISFETCDGKTVKGYTLGIDLENNKCVVINYPVLLIDNKYKITVFGTLRSNTGMQLEETVLEEFICKNPNMFYDYDFTAYFDEKDIGRTLKKNEIPGLVLSDETSGQTVGVLENGDTYISMIPQLQAKEYQLIAEFPEAVTNGDIAVVEAKLRRTGKSAYACDMGRINGDASTNGPNFYDGKISNTSIDKDEYGFSDIKYMIRRGADGYYYTEIIYYVGGVPVTAAKSYSSREISAINYILMAHLYTTSAPSSNGYEDSIDIKSLKIYKAKEVMALSSNLEGYDTEKKETITVSLTVPAKPDTVSADTIYLRDKDSGEKIPWDFISYDEDIMSAEFKLNDTYLSCGKEYEIVCDSLESINGIKSKRAFVKTFMTAAYRIKCGADASFVYANGEVSFESSLERQNSEQLKAVLILYNAGGRIKKISEAEAVWTGINGSIKVSLNDDNAVNGDYAAVYLIDITDNAFAPITEVPEKLIINI